jgi:hypothetical protein
LPDALDNDAAEYSETPEAILRSIHAPGSYVDGVPAATPRED